LQGIADRLAALDGTLVVGSLTSSAAVGERGDREDEPGARLRWRMVPPEKNPPTPAIRR
jgi:hypothetical protein